MSANKVVVELICYGRVSAKTRGLMSGFFNEGSSAPYNWWG
jgi:hypothetical protein